jgi:hypothetical protein
MLIVMPLWLWLLYAPIHLAIRAACWLVVLCVRAIAWTVPRLAERSRRWLRSGRS